MIVTRTPFRISLGGGGTDLPAYADKYDGFVFSATIDKYMYIVLNEPFDDLIRLKYSKSETVDNIDNLEHSLAREALKHCNIKNKIDIVSLADIPAGTGLGSSGAYLVGLLHALAMYKKWHIVATPRLLAEQAYTIESKVLSHPVGYQDQFMAAFGGFNVLMNTGENIFVKSIHLDSCTIHKLNTNLLLFYTHTRHNSNTILAEEKKEIESGKAVQLLHKIKEIGIQTKAAIQSNNLDEIGYLMDEHWKLKRQVSSVMSNSAFDKIYNRALICGALGGKIIGSGGAGFFMFYVPKNRGKFVIEMEKLGLKYMPYTFEFEGSKVIANI